MLSQLLCYLFAKLYPTLCNPIDCSLPDSSVHGISQAKILEWVAISFSRGFSWPRGWTHVSCIGRLVLYHWTAAQCYIKDHLTCFHCLFLATALIGQFPLICLSGDSYVLMYLLVYYSFLLDFFFLSYWNPHV